jgi:hypothetical protein
MRKIVCLLIFGILLGQSAEEILSDLFLSTNGKNWKDNTNWTVTDNACNWFGIECTDNVVTGVYLQGNNLQVFDFIIFYYFFVRVQFLPVLEI